MIIDLDELRRKADSTYREAIAAIDVLTRLMRAGDDGGPSPARSAAVRESHRKRRDAFLVECRERPGEPPMFLSDMAASAGRVVSTVRTAILRAAPDWAEINGFHYRRSNANTPQLNPLNPKAADPPAPAEPPVPVAETAPEPEPRTPSGRKLRSDTSFIECQELPDQPPMIIREVAAMTGRVKSCVLRLIRQAAPGWAEINGRHFRQLNPPTPRPKPVPPPTSPAAQAATLIADAELGLPRPPRINTDPPIPPAVKGKSYQPSRKALW